MTRRLGDILLEQQRVTPEQLDQLLTNKPTDMMLGDWLLENRILSEQGLGETLSEQFEVPYADIDPSQLNHQVMRLLPEDFARYHQAVAIGVSGRKLRLAMVAPDDIEAIAEAELMTGYEIQPEVALAEVVRAAIGIAYDERTLARQTIIDMKIAELAETREVDPDSVIAAELTDDEAPVVRLVQAILTGAVTARASDIHLEPHNPEMRVRYRIDGQLQQVMTIPNHIEESVISRIKVMADMDTTESRRPQDGQLSVVENGSKVNYRVSNIPTIGGQKLVLRLLEEGSRAFELDRLGLCDSNLSILKQMLDQPFGMVKDPNWMGAVAAACTCEGLAEAPVLADLQSSVRMRHHRSVGQQTLRALIPVFAAACLLLPLQWYTRHTSDERAALHTELASLQETCEQWNTLSRTLRTDSTILEAYEIAEAKIHARAELQHLLEWIPQCLPDSARLLRLQLNANGTIQITGTAIGESTIFAFTEHLREIPGVVDVQLQGTTPGSSMRSQTKFGLLIRTQLNVNAQET